MPEERRQGDLLIMDKLSAIQDKMGTMHTELALNTRETSRMAEYQKFTNGKVASLESRIQTVEAAQALTSTTLAQIQSKETQQATKKYDWFVWVVRGFIVFAITTFGWIIFIILTRLGFINFPR